MMNVLPENGSFVTLKCVQETKNLLVPSEEEVNNYEMVTMNGQTQFNKKGKELIHIPISPMGLEIIKDAFRKLEDSNKLKLEQVDTYEKIMGEK